MSARAFDSAGMDATARAVRGLPGGRRRPVVLPEYRSLLTARVALFVGAPEGYPSPSATRHGLAPLGPSRN